MTTRSRKESRLSSISRVGFVLVNTSVSFCCVFATIDSVFEPSRRYSCTKAHEVVYGERCECLRHVPHSLSSSFATCTVCRLVR